MSMPIDITNASKTTAQNITKLQIATGRQPATIAGVSIFIVSQLSKQKKSCSEIANAVGVTEPTIRQAYKEIYEYRN